MKRKGHIISVKGAAMKRLFKTIISILLLLVFLVGCTGKGISISSETEVSSSTTVISSFCSEPVSSEPAQSDPGEEAHDPCSHYTFQWKVCSSFLRDVFGDAMCDSWFSLVDAIMTGSDTFECPDDDTCKWMMGQFPCRCLPPLIEQIYTGGDPDHPVKDGRVTICYMTSREETIARICDFADRVERILNETLKDDYSDFEKALAMYQYFTSHYEYDYESYEKMKDQPVEYLSAYRLIMEGKGICSDIAPAYAFMLMQAGVDCGTMSGQSNYSGEGHEWAYIRLGEHYYHIDPTYGLSEPESLRYFLMTDDQRDSGEYPRSSFEIISHYSKDHPHEEYIADDTFFSPLWYGFDFVMDHSREMIIYKAYDYYGDLLDLSFTYSGY